jgi:hypothetical protein
MKLFKLNETTFENYDITVRNYLTKTLGAVGLQYSNSQIFSIIFDGIKSIMQNAMFYIEDALTEQNIDTAYRKSSIYSLAKISGYDAFYGSAATGLVNCLVSINNGLDLKTNKVYIKNYSKIVNTETGYQYLVYLPSDYYVIDLSKPLNINQFKIVQGSFKTNLYISQGVPLETINVNTLGLFDIEYVEVRVDGELYSPVSTLYDMTENSKEYVLSTGYDNELDIIFGNGIHGKQLVEGQSVSIKYIIHNGISGNININDKSTLEFKDSLYDSFGNTISNIDFLSLSLATSITGGMESDTVSNIKNMIGYNSRSLVLASDKNYTLFLKRFSFVGNTKVWCENNSLVVNAVCITNFIDNISDYTKYFSAYDDNIVYLSDYQKSIIKTTLNNSNKTFAGISFNFIDPIIYKYAILVYLKVDKSYNREVVNSEISKLIADYFMNLKPNTVFVAKSDVIKYILDNVTYLDSIDISFISDINENAKYNGYYYAYEKVNKDNNWQYKYTKQVYNKENHLGLDDFGNINVEDKFGMPLISNNVIYTVEEDNSKYTFENAVNFIYM